MSWDSSTVSVGDPTEKADYDRLLDNTIFLYSSTLTFTGEKTFQSSTVFVKPIVLSGGIDATLVGVSGTNTTIAIFTKYLSTGPWNLDTGAILYLDHGLDLSSIVSVHGIIRNDAGTINHNLPSVGDDPTQVNLYVGSISTTQILVGRTAGGYFDGNPAYTSTSFDRGIFEVRYKT